jgi:hypothetical protein
MPSSGLCRAISNRFATGIDGPFTVEVLGIILRSFSVRPTRPAGEDSIECYFNQPAVLNRIRDGIMSPYLDALAAELEAQHYSRLSIRRQLRNSDCGWCKFR